MSPDTKVFISHASEDKEVLARPLAERLKERCHVWYDEYSLPYGGSIFGSISAGLRDCDFGVAVLSHSFFKKKWTQDEIAGLVGREEPGHYRIVPVWLDVTREDVARFSPILADRRAISADQDVDAIIECIVQAIDEAAAAPGFVHAPAQEDPREALRKLGEEHREVLSRKTMNASPEASQNVHRAQTELVQSLSDQIESIALENPHFRISWNSSQLHCIPYDLLYLNVTLPNQDVIRLETTRPAGFIEGLRLDVNVFRPKQDKFGNFEMPDRLEDHHFVPKLDGEGTVFWKEGDSSPLDHSGFVDFFLGTLHTHLQRVLKLG